MAHKLRWSTAIAVVLVFGLACPAAANAADKAERCNLRLAVTFTPDVPSDQAPGFLGAILSDPQYKLTWLGGTDTQANLQLTGPGPASQCQDAVNQLSRDTHVLNVRVVQRGRGT